MKTILIILLFASAATAQPHTTEIKTKTKIAGQRHTAMAKWRDRLKTFHTPASRASKEYIDLRKEMRKELLSIRQGNAGEQQFGMPIGAESTGSSTAAVHPFGSKTKLMSGFDTSQLHNVPSIVLTADHCSEIPFPEMGHGSTWNVLELSVANNSALALEGLRAELSHVPSWLKFSETIVDLASIKPMGEVPASFRFTVDKTAELNKNETIYVTVTNEYGQKWTKEIALKIAPPTHFDLFQNYPNPFNPTTMIGYQLSSAGKVNVRIYDVLGREVADIVNEPQNAGYHQITWDAGRLASGVYLYRLLVADETNTNHILQKKMILQK